MTAPAGAASASATWTRRRPARHWAVRSPSKGGSQAGTADGGGIWGAPGNGPGRQDRGAGGRPVRGDRRVSDGMGRMLLLGDLGQQLDIHEAAGDIEALKAALRSKTALDRSQ